jgi:DNA-binding GntR family transcriptional regulator
MQIVVRTLSDQIYDRLRDKIVTHEIAPGEAIRPDVLAAELGISKIPIREALARLEGCGIVRSAPNRGFIATPISKAEATDIFALRLLLEPPIASATTLKADQAQRDQVASALQAVASASLSVRDNMNARRAMTAALLTQPGRPLAIGLLLQLFDRSERYHRGQVTEAFLDVDGLKALVRVWLDRDAAAVHSHYEQRLLTRSRLAQEAVLSHPEARAPYPSRD